MVSVTPDTSTEFVDSSIIEASVYGQLRAARVVLETIPELVRLVQERPDDTELGEALEPIIEKLLRIGGELAESADQGGGSLSSVEQ